MKTRVGLALIFLGVLLGAIGAYLLMDSQQLSDKEAKAMRGELLPFEIDSQKPIEIQVGGVHVEMTLNQLSEGFNLSRLIYFGFDYPFQISLKDNRFLVSVDIKNANGETVAKTVDNQWAVNNNPVIAYDRNYNSYVFEVIDSDLIPVIQVIFSPQNKMYLGGFFYVPNATMLLTDDSLIIAPSPENITYARDHSLFKYPSEDHLGETVAKTTYQIIRTSTWIFWAGWTVIGVGGLLTAIGTANTDYVQKKRRNYRKH